VGILVSVASNGTSLTLEEHRRHPLLPLDTGLPPMLLGHGPGPPAQDGQQTPVCSLLQSPLIRTAPSAA
jgi:hypothetical protein